MSANRQAGRLPLVCDKLVIQVVDDNDVVRRSGLERSAYMCDGGAKEAFDEGEGRRVGEVAPERGGATAGGG